MSNVHNLVLLLEMLCYATRILRQQAIGDRAHRASGVRAERAGRASRASPVDVVAIIIICHLLRFSAGLEQSTIQTSSHFLGHFCCCK